MKASRLICRHSCVSYGTSPLQISAMTMASDQMSAAGPICVLGVSDRISGEDQLIFLRKAKRRRIAGHEKEVDLVD